MPFAFTDGRVIDEFPTGAVNFGAGTAINSTAPFSLSARVVYLGNSITFNDGWVGFARWAQTFAGGRYFGNPVLTTGGSSLPTGWNQGVTGNLTADVIARLSNVGAESPKAVPVLIGTNDIGTGPLPTATITANLATIYSYIVSIGATPVPITILPRGSVGWSSQMEQVRLDTNAFIMAQGYPFVISSNFIQDASTTYLSTDATHPNAFGAQQLGQGVANVLTTLISTARILDNPSGTNLLSNPNFANSSNTSSGWTWFPNPSNGLTHSTSATTIGSDAAQCIQGTGTATSAVGDILSQTITPGAAGTYEFWCEIQMDSMVGCNGIAVASNRSSAAMFSISAQSTGGLCTVPWSGVVRSPPATVASSTQSIQPALSILPASGFVGVSYQIRVASAMLRAVQ